MTPTTGTRVTITGTNHFAGCTGTVVRWDRRGAGPDREALVRLDDSPMGERFADWYFTERELVTA